MSKTMAVLKALATNRVTYKFLIAVLLAAGMTSGVEWVGKVEVIVCTLVTQCS